MTDEQILARIRKAKNDKARHESNAEWREAETKSCLIIRLEELLIAQQRERAMEGEEV